MAQAAKGTMFRGSCPCRLLYESVRDPWELGAREVEVHGSVAGLWWPRRGCSGPDRLQHQAAATREISGRGGVQAGTRRDPPAGLPGDDRPQLKTRTDVDTDRL